VELLKNKEKSMKIKKYSEMINESFKDNKKGMGLHQLLNHKSSYKDLVYRKLYDVICDEDGISEKAFSALDELTETLEKFYEENKSELDSIIQKFEDENKRSNYCAEEIYSKFKIK